MSGETAHAENKTYPEIAERLRDLRIRHGSESRKDWAETHGYNYGQYRMWESGARRIPVEAATQLCERYGVTLDYIYRGLAVDAQPTEQMTTLPDTPALDTQALTRIAEALERMAPPPLHAPDFTAADAFVWHVSPDRLEPVPQVNRVDLPLLIGIERSRDTLLANTLQFARGLPANNALLWGARGMGKSSLVKAVHAEVLRQGERLKIVELQREDLPSVGRLLGYLRGSAERFVLFCDDLSFSHDDQHYKSLKAVLDGGIEGRPDNVVFYATSNRRHLMPRDMIENERSSAISPSEATEEKVSLSDRFGLWLGFHPCTQDEYLAMIQGYCDAHGLTVDPATLRAEAIEWQATRGARSGRVAWQFFTDLAGRQGVRV